LSGREVTSPAAGNPAGTRAPPPPASPTVGEIFFPTNRLKLPINSSRVFSPFPTPSSSLQQRPIAPPPPPPPFAPPPRTSTARRSLPRDHLLKLPPTKVSTGVGSPRPPLSFPSVPGRRRPLGRRQSPALAGPAARSSPCLCSVRRGWGWLLANTPCPFFFLPEYPSPYFPPPFFQTKP
jgi:hypothetical protein